MFVVDTNVLIYAANPEADLHSDCRAFVQKCRERAAPWYLPWPVCYEFMRVCTHPHVFPRPWSADAAWSFLQSLLDAPGAGFLLPGPQHANVLREVLEEFPHLRGNILHDVHTVVLMREHGIKEIYTRDMHFHRFPFLTVRDPVS
ncbi:MAG: TA system VapC family ribonuclease toxin [Chthoniobacterales bacterium]